MDRHALDAAAFDRVLAAIGAHQPDEHVELIAERIRAHDETWVAEDEGRLLGFLAIEHSTNLAAAVLERLYVEPADRLKGLGSSLLRQAVDYGLDKTAVRKAYRGPTGRGHFLPDGLRPACGPSPGLRH